MKCGTSGYKGLAGEPFQNFALVSFVFKLFSAGSLLFGLTASRQAHDFHASVTQMQYNPKEKAFEISIRLFTDDLEKALTQELHTPVHLSPGSKSDAILEKYIQARFSYVTPQKQPKAIKYVGHEVEVDANWIYLEMPYTDVFHGGLLKQNVLMEAFEDQVNMVNIQYQGQKKTFVFRKNQPIQEVSFLNNKFIQVLASAFSYFTVVTKRPVVTS